MIERRCISLERKKQRNIASLSLLFFFFLCRDWLATKILREKESGADNFPGDSEKERSSIVLYRETRASGYKRGWGSSSILTATMEDRNDRRKETIKERIVKK